MYRAKAKGKNDYATFHPSMETVAHERLQFQAEFSRAIEEEQLVLHYQPVIDLRDGRIIGAEALVRWNHPERGLLGPCEFIQPAEETGLVVPLGRWVLNTACRQTRLWNERFGEMEVAVNISARHVQSDDFVGDVLNVLEETGLDPRRLVLELTESTLLSDLVGSCVRLASLKEIGVRVALDDFGIGYSSLGYLRDLPVDILKIDRSFLAQLGDGEQHMEFVRAICTLSRSLSLTTIAEGVEDTTQLGLLRALEVDQAQGYYFSRPVDAEKLVQLLPKRRCSLGPAYLGGGVTACRCGAAAASVPLRRRRVS